MTVHNQEYKRIQESIDLDKSILDREESLSPEREDYLLRSIELKQNVLDSLDKLFNNE